MTVRSTRRQADDTGRLRPEEVWQAARDACRRSQALIAESREALRRHCEEVSRLRSALAPARGGGARDAAADGHDRPFGFDEVVVVGELRLMPLRTAVVGRGRPVPLTPAEWRLLASLVQHRRTVLSRAELATRAWGPAFADRRSEVEVYVSRLRRKLARAGTSARILTVRGQGYRLSVDGDREIPG